MSARQQKTAADCNPQLDKKKQDLNAENNETTAIISMNCHAAQLLKFLQFSAFYAPCTSFEKIIKNYSRVVIICEDAGGKFSQIAFLKKFAENGNVYFFPIYETVFEWYQRLQYAGCSMACDVMKSAFDSAKPLEEFLKNGKF